MFNNIEPHHEVSIVYFVENGVQCWSLDLDDVDMCQQRGYAYTVVTYTRKQNG